MICIYIHIYISSLQLITFYTSTFIASPGGGDDHKTYIGGVAPATLASFIGIHWLNSENL